MKKNSYTFFIFIIVALQGFAQSKIVLPGPVYDKMKAEGALKPGVDYIIAGQSPVNKGPGGQPAVHDKVKKQAGRGSRTNSCNCNVPVDPTFSVAPFSNSTFPDYRNDDGSTNAIALPFSFCFYGTTYNSVFINNNGNITFGSSTSGFSAGGFPAIGDIMIAPFWADVDTRDPGSGLVYYKITPTYMIVKWDGVGYFSSQSDLLNDFQLIISNGLDPIIPNNNNVAFCYGDMQWTTGSASGGTNGFGGTAANAGINKGDGTNYFQIGRFNQNSGSYDGPYNNDDGINYLDNKSYYFSTCAPGNNIPPVLSPYIGVCDSFKICGTTDTLVYLLSFSSPESGQIVSSITASAPTLGPAFTVLSTTTGQTGTILFRIIANPGLIGTHVITITAQDNGTPAASSVITYVVPILSAAGPTTPQISTSPSIICAGGGSSVFSLVNPSLYDGYIWGNGVTGSSINVSDGDAHYITVNKNGCYKSTYDSVDLRPSPTPLILGSLAICNSSPTTLYVDSAGLYPNISWSTGSTNDSVNVPSGTYTVTVTGTNTCTATSPAVTVTSVALNVTGAATFCMGDSVLLTANANPAAGASYLWSTSATTSSIYAHSTGNYYATVSYPNGCILTDSLSVIALPVGVPVTAMSYTSPVCKLGANPVPIPVPGFTPYGTYSSVPVGLSINSTTGVINLAASTAGIYDVTYTVAATACNPFRSSTTSITINPPATPVTGFSYSAVCANGTNPFPATAAGLTPNGIYSSASGMSINDSTGEIYLSSSYPGTYAVNYSTPADTTLAGCRASGTGTANAVINPLPVIGSVPDQSIWIGNSATLIAHGGTAVWSPAFNLSCTLCDTTVANPQVSQIYCVVVTDTIGCIDSTCMKLSVEIPCPTNRNLEMPNAFTPNADGYNDELCLYGWNDCVNEFSIIIFDRWGEKVFESTDPDFCWNGIYKGKLLDPGVFVYFVKAVFTSSGDTPLSETSTLPVTKKGNISIVY